MASAEIAADLPSPIWDPLPLSPCGRGWLASSDARRGRGLSPRIETPHPARSGAQVRSKARHLLPQGEKEESSTRPCQRAVDHRHRIWQPIHRDERAEARAFFLAEQHLVEHVEPVERDAGPAVLALLHRIQERLAPPGLATPRLAFLPRG